MYVMYETSLQSQALESTVARTSRWGHSHLARGELLSRPAGGVCLRKLCAFDWMTCMKHLRRQVYWTLKRDARRSVALDADILLSV